MHKYLTSPMYYVDTSFLCICYSKFFLYFKWMCPFSHIDFCLLLSLGRQSLCLGKRMFALFNKIDYYNTAIKFYFFSACLAFHCSFIALISSLISNFAGGVFADSSMIHFPSSPRRTGLRCCTGTIPNGLCGSD